MVTSGSKFIISENTDMGFNGTTPINNPEKIAANKSKVVTNFTNNDVWKALKTSEFKVFDRFLIIFDSH